MAVSLQKGQKVDLTKTNPGLTQIKVGLGWDTNKYDGGGEFDLDVSVFLLNELGKVEATNISYSSTTRKALTVPWFTPETTALALETAMTK